MSKIEAEFPFRRMNPIRDKSSTFPGGDDEEISSHYPYVIKEVQGIKVGILGLISNYKNVPENQRYLLTHFFLDIPF